MAAALCLTISHILKSSAVDSLEPESDHRGRHADDASSRSWPLAIIASRSKRGVYRYDGSRCGMGGLHVTGSRARNYRCPSKASGAGLASDCVGRTIRVEREPPMVGYSTRRHTLWRKALADVNCLNSRMFRHPSDQIATRLECVQELSLIPHAARRALIDVSVFRRQEGENAKN